jgi:hypothetical protein
VGSFDGQVDGGHVLLYMRAVVVVAPPQRPSVFFCLFELFLQLGDGVGDVADVLRQL